MKTQQEIEKYLARKTQECESLKQEIEILQNNYDTATRDCNEEIARLEQECEELEKLVQQAQEAPICFKCEQEPCIRQERDRYRKALDEIEEELKEDIYCESQECGCDDFEECLKCTKEHILDIINKAKGEECN